MVVQSLKTTDKGLNQAYCGNGGSSFRQKLSDMANWASNKATKRESKHQSGYAMAYTETEHYSQVNCSNHEMGYGMTEFPNNHGQGHNSHHNGHGHGFDSHSSNGMAQSQIQAFGYGYGSGSGPGKHTSPGKRQNHAFGYGYGSAPANHTQNGAGHGFDYQTTEAYRHDEFEENYMNNGMAQRQQCHVGKQSYGPKKNMGYGVSETQTCLYRKTETHYGGAHANTSAGFGQGGCSPNCNCMNCCGMRKNKVNHSAGGFLKKIKDGISGNDCSDSDDDDFARRKAWVSKALC